MGAPLRTVTADRGDAGRRLDLVLRRHLTGVEAASRTRVQAWIAEGHVSVNGTPVRRVAARAAVGDVLTIVLPEPKVRIVAAPEQMSVEVLYEDELFFAVNKPAGMVVHPTYRHSQGTLLNGLLWHARQWPAHQRPSLVGRLDKLTSGVLLVAKTAAVHAALQRETSAPRSVKEYLAVVYGRVHPARGKIDLPLGRDPRDQRKVVASRTSGAPSLTSFQRLARAAAPRPGLALLQCRISTGRMHQIRAHLSARGWPIVGDPVYGEPRWRDVADPALAEFLRSFPRQALHSWRVAFTHPLTRRPLVIDAPAPADIVGLLAASGLTPDGSVPHPLSSRGIRN